MDPSSSADVGLSALLLSEAFALSSGAFDLPSLSAGAAGASMLVVWSSGDAALGGELPPQATAAKHATPTTTTRAPADPALVMRAVYESATRTASLGRAASLPRCVASTSARKLRRVHEKIPVRPSER